MLSLTVGNLCTYGSHTFKNNKTTFVSEPDILLMQIWNSSNTGSVRILDLIEGSDIHTLDLQEGEKEYLCHINIII